MKNESPQFTPRKNLRAWAIEITTTETEGKRARYCSSCTRCFCSSPPHLRQILPFFSLRAQLHTFNHVTAICHSFATVDCPSGGSRSRAQSSTRFPFEVRYESSICFPFVESYKRPALRTKLTLPAKETITRSPPSSFHNPSLSPISLA